MDPIDTPHHRRLVRDARRYTLGEVLACWVLVGFYAAAAFSVAWWAAAEVGASTALEAE